MNTRKLIVTTLAALAVGGCTVGPDFKLAERKMPEHFIGPTTRPTTRPSITLEQPVDIATWWRNFHDPVLNSLIAQAIDANFDLQQATARIRQARAQRDVNFAGLWPTANVSGSYTRSGANGGNVRVNPGGGATVSASTNRDLYQAGFDAAWEIDVFGGVRRQLESADADIRAAIEDRHDVMVTLTSEVAVNYINLRGLQRQLDIANENLKTQQDSAAVTHKKQSGGLVGSLDVANADALVASTQAEIPVLDQSIRQAIYDLALLMGKEPQTLIAQLEPEAQIPLTPSSVPIGLPSELLRRRPDVRRAEEQLHSATAQIGVATADLFPKFSLTGSVGLEGNKPKSLTSWDNGFWSFGPSVSWPIFDAGSIRAGIAVQNAVQEQAALTYEQTVLTALHDVESALVAYADEQRHRALLVQSVAANRKAVDVSQQLYKQGQTDFLNVLSAQRSLLSAEDSLAQSERTVATDLVAIYKALGGGWQGSDIPVANQSRAGAPTPPHS